jgi:hypothetical protein
MRRLLRTGTMRWRPSVQFGGSRCDTTESLMPYTFVVENIEPSKAKGSAGHYEVQMALYRDPFTPPHTKTDCDKLCGGGHFCCGWRVFYQWMYVTPILIVDFGTVGDYLAIVQGCHNDAVAAGIVAGIVAGYLSGGTAGAKAAVDTYIAAVTACLTQKLSAAKLASVQVVFRSHWGDWE